ncbi:hypothetical protein [Vulcanisaeta distributa]|nr:hypothetical protein [Vulcanisaeta distributa]
MSVVSTVMVMSMVNAWNESVRLASILLKRLRDYDEKSVKRYFTKDCLRYDLADRHYDKRIKRCLRTWYFRALITIASLLHPLVKAYGKKIAESAIKEVDLSRIDVRESLIKDLSNAVYDAVIGYVMNNVRRISSISNDVVISKLINSGIGDLLAQITRIELLLKNCSKEGKVIYEGEELDCTDLLLYNMELSQILAELQRLARKYDISIELTKHPWWLWL